MVLVRGEYEKRAVTYENHYKEESTCAIQRLTIAVSPNSKTDRGKPHLLIVIISSRTSLFSDRANARPVLPARSTITIAPAQEFLAFPAIAYHTSISAYLFSHRDGFYFRLRAKIILLKHLEIFLFGFQHQR